jgi:hypothetical protein
MKKLFTLLALIVTTTINAQAPQGFNYQATVRNSSGALIINQNVLFKFNIMLNSQTSLPVYSETHQAPTDDLGQVNLIIGTGTATTTGSFSAINWGTGNYFLGIELNTGSGYVAMGTTQLLSVPYALYANSAGSTQSQGKTSIYLTGNITNAQAAAKLATELGPDTENIYIRNTTQLTDLDLSSLVTAVNISLEHNDALTNVNLNDLTTVFEKFYVDDNPLLNLAPTSLTDCYVLSVSTISTLNLSGLLRSNMISISNITNFSGLSNLISCESLGINSINNLSTLNFPSLSSANVTIQDNSSLTSIALPLLSSGGVNIYLNPLITSIALPVFSSGGIGISGALLTSISLPLFSSGGLAIDNNSSLTSIALPVFSSGDVNIQQNSVLNSIALPVFSTGNVNIQQNSVLSSIGLPALTSAIGIKISENTLLTSIAFPALTTINNQIFLYNNALTTTNINYLLHKMLTVSPTIAKFIQLYGQTPPAPPTGQGLIDKQTLINAGNTVGTD